MKRKIKKKNKKNKTKEKWKNVTRWARKCERGNRDGTYV